MYKTLTGYGTLTGHLRDTYRTLTGRNPYEALGKHLQDNNGTLTGHLRDGTPTLGTHLRDT